MREECNASTCPRRDLFGTAIGLPIGWGGVRGVNGSAMAVPWSVWVWTRVFSPELNAGAKNGKFVLESHD